MKKKTFAIIGKPLSHSLSPVLHNYWFKKYNIEANYEAFEINDSDIEKVLEKIKKRELSGINVTLPYKQKVIPYLSEMINDAKLTNSVNTIFLDHNDNLVGDNTDVFGLQAAYLKNLSLLDNSLVKALILGAGGVAPSIINALNKSNIKNISLTNRTHEKSLFLKKQFPYINLIKWGEYQSKIINFDIIINATSLGLKNGENFDKFPNDIKEKSVYIDTVYNPLDTEMIKHFKSRNIKTYNGLDMLIYQGQKSFYIWNKINPEIDEELISLLEKQISL